MTVLIMNCTICQNLPPLLLILVTMMMIKTKMNISWRKWRQGRSWQSWPTLRRCCIFLQTALSLITAKKWKQKWAAKNKGQGLSRRNWKKRAEQDGKYQDGESCWGRTVGGTELNGAGAVCVFLATSRCLFSRLLFLEADLEHRNGCLQHLNQEHARFSVCLPWRPLLKGWDIKLNAAWISYSLIWLFWYGGFVCEMR